jgi:hypothetical protein
MKIHLVGVVLLHASKMEGRRDGYDEASSSFSLS